MQLPSDANCSGRGFGPDELDQLRRVLESGTLNRTQGTVVREFERRFALSYGSTFCRTTTSGTASIHTAVAAIDPEPGDEIITSPITDMGALTPILYQSAIPIFADVDPATYNVTAETIEPKITRRTKAIIVTHLFGNPCDMDPIVDLARRHSLPVIEDACQAFLCEYKGRLAGTIGDIGCFSLQQGKHMTTGEGGIVITNDSRYARRMSLFVDKAWGYGDPEPDHYFLALNYRMTELQGAVALAQLDKLRDVVERRIRSAEVLRRRLELVPGISPPVSTPQGKHVYWKFPIQVDANAVDGGPDALGRALRERGISCAPRYIQKPAFLCRIFTERNTFGASQFPFIGDFRKADPPVVYDPAEYPGAFEALSKVVVLAWNEFYTDEHCNFIAGAVEEAAASRRVMSHA